MSRQARKPLRTNSTRTRLPLETLERRTLMAASLIDDINPYGSNPSNIAQVGDKIFFTEADASGGDGLYRPMGPPPGRR